MKAYKNVFHIERTLYGNLSYFVQEEAVNAATKKKEKPPAPAVEAPLFLENRSREFFEEDGTCVVNSRVVVKPT